MNNFKNLFGSTVGFTGYLKPSGDFYFLDNNGPCAVHVNKLGEEKDIEDECSFDRYVIKSCYIGRRHKNSIENFGRCV